jgi:putative ABC transport system substrate-binding protein
LPANDEALALIRTHFPAIRKLGALYCPAETNMVQYKLGLDAAAKRAGFEVVYVPAETATDVPDASAALMSRDIDAVLQIPGNLTASAFGSLSEAARRAHVPVFAFQKSQAIGGAMVVVARDYRDSGRHAAFLAARIMRGENPKHIPLEDFGKTNLVVNLDAARALDLTLPPALVRSAKEVLGDSHGNR